MHEQLERRIAIWREELAGRIGPEAATLDELECHLRDEVDRQVKQGQTPEQAFQIAATRIGSAEQLGPEFSKIAAPWWPIRIVAAFIAILGIYIVWFLVYHMEPERSNNNGWLYPHIFAIVLGYLLCFGIGILADCYAVQRAFGELPLGKRVSWNRAQKIGSLAAFVFTSVGIVLGALWLKQARGVYWSWDPREISGLAILGWLAVQHVSARRCARSPRWLMICGVVGGLIVMVAWYGQLLGPMVALFALVHVPVLIAGLPRSGWLKRRATSA